MVAKGTFFFGNDADSAIKKAHRLAEDLARIMGGEAPSPRELDSAPFLDNWTLVPIQRIALAGTVTGHPRLGDCELRSTEIFVLNQRFARTWSRFYRLGQPLANRGRDQ
jgi:hypothetical protein